ncbi:MAG TPA: sugar phosphate isomerase/epimerase family protein [Acidobacteriota bacterium]
MSRRRFVAGAGVLSAALPLRIMANRSPFRLSIITDEISQDFAHALEVASKEFGCSWVELRGMWDKNLMRLDDKEVEEVGKIIEKFQMQVSCIASPLFKVDWPGAPVSKFSPRRDQFNADFTFDQQDEVLQRCIRLAKVFKTDRVRCFDFWRLDDPAPYRAAMDDRLRRAADRAFKQGIALVLENETACNSATSAEAVRTLKAVNANGLMLNWDPGNAASRGETPFPDGYKLLPKKRLGHLHCKDVIRNNSPEGYDWAAVGRGVIDYVGLFRALKKDGYRRAVSLETHWRGAGTAEASSRESMAGLKGKLRQAGAL